jgi:hypothetical protein
LAVEGIDLIELGAGVATAEVGDAEVGAEEVRAVAEKLWRVEGCGYGFIPTVFEEAKAWLCCHVELLGR